MALQIVPGNSSSTGPAEPGGRPVHDLRLASELSLWRASGSCRYGHAMTVFLRVPVPLARQIQEERLGSRRPPGTRGDPTTIQIIMDTVEFAANTATILLSSGTLALAVRRTVQWLRDRELNAETLPSGGEQDNLKLTTSESTTSITIHRGSDGSIDVEETTTEVLRIVERRGWSS